MKWLHRLVPKSFEPVRAVEWVIAVFTFVIGLYILSPFYEYSTKIHGKSAFATALQDPALIFIYAGILLAGSILIMIGLVWFKPPLLSTGLFVIGLVRIFQVLTTLLVLGPTPINWIHPLTIAFVCIVLWIWTRIGIINGRS